MDLDRYFRAMSAVIYGFWLGLMAISLFLILTGCDSVPKPPPPVKITPAPLAPDPRICAALEGEPDVQGGIVQPRSQEARDAVQAFLNGELDLLFWGRRGWTRAEIAKTQYCGKR